MSPKPTGYWRQEKDDQGRATRIYELMDDGTEMETGYKHAYEGGGVEFTLKEWALGILFFIPALIYMAWELVADRWRWK